MSKKKRRKKSKSENEEENEGTYPFGEEFSLKVKSFLGKVYINSLRDYNQRNQMICIGSLLKVDPLSPLLEDSEFLPPDEHHPLLKKKKATELQKFYEENVGGGSKKLSKKIIVDNIIAKLMGEKTTDPKKRENELKNIDPEYISSSTSHFTLSGIVIPRDVMLEILSYLRFNLLFLETVGSVNKSFYLLALSNWKEEVPITFKSLYKISAVILKSMTKFEVGKVTNKELEYLRLRFSPSRIREIRFSSSCSLHGISKFFRFYKKKKTVFTNLHTLHFSQIEVKKSLKKKLIQIPSYPIPNVQTIHNLQLNRLDISELKKVKNVVFGDRFNSPDWERCESECVVDFPRYDPRLAIFGSPHFNPRISYENVSIDNSWCSKLSRQEKMSDSSFDKYDWKKLRCLGSRFVSTNGMSNIFRFVKRIAERKETENIQKLELLLPRTKDWSFFDLSDVINCLPGLVEMRVIMCLPYHRNITLGGLAGKSEPCKLKKLDFYGVKISVVDSLVRYFENLDDIYVGCSSTKHFESVSIPDFLGRLLRKRNVKVWIEGFVALEYGGRIGRYCFYGDLKIEDVYNEEMRRMKEGFDKAVKMLVVEGRLRVFKSFFKLEKYDQMFFERMDMKSLGFVLEHKNKNMEGVSRVYCLEIFS